MLVSTTYVSLSSVARVNKRKPRAFRSLAAWSAPAVTRPRVTRRQLVTRALDVLDDEGFDGLTMRRLAERLGIKAASLYNHVADKDELLALVADALCEEMSEPDGAKPWRDQLETVAFQCRTVLMAHRDGARVLAATAPMGPHRLRLIESVLRALVGAGFSAAKAADAGFVFNAYVVGFVLDETLGGTRGVASSKRMREEGRLWFKALPQEPFPTLVALADELVDGPPARRFELGLRALLDGFELRLPRTKRLRRRA